MQEEKEIYLAVLIGIFAGLLFVSLFKTQIYGIGILGFVRTCVLAILTIMTARLYSNETQNRS